MPPPSKLRVSCPACRADLVVDSATGTVLSHEAAAVPKADMAEALKALKEGKSRREDIFRQSLSAEKKKSEILKDKFDEAMRKAKENPEAPLPPREIDL